MPTKVLGHEILTHERIHGIRVRITHSDWIKLKKLGNDNERAITSEVRMLIKKHLEETENGRLGTRRT